MSEGNVTEKTSKDNAIETIDQRHSTKFNPLNLAIEKISSILVFIFSGMVINYFYKPALASMNQQAGVVNGLLIGAIVLGGLITFTVLIFLMQFQIKIIYQILGQFIALGVLAVLWIQFIGPKINPQEMRELIEISILAGLMNSGSIIAIGVNSGKIKPGELRKRVNVWLAKK